MSHIVPPPGARYQSCVSMRRWQSGMFRTLSILVACVLMTGLQSLQGGVITSGLIGYWAADGNAKDSSSTGNNGLFHGAYVPGKVGQAFDINTALVIVPDNSAYNFGASPVTIGFWFNDNGQSLNSVTLLGQDNGGGGQDKWFIDYGYFSSGAFDLHLNGSAGSAFIPANPTSIPSGWNQFTMVRSGTSFQFFLNGANIGSETSSANFSNPTANLLFGYSEPALLEYRGLLDEVVIYNRALTAEEVQQLASIPEPASALLVAGALLCSSLLVRKRKKSGLSSRFK